MKPIVTGCTPLMLALILAVTTALSVCGAHIFDGDGSDEAGFVPPPPRQEIPPPPANMAGGETFIPYPRKESRRPPRRPVRKRKIRPDLRRCSPS